MSAAAQKILAVSDLNDHHHSAELSTMYLILKLVDSQAASDASVDPYTELFTTRLGAYADLPVVKRLREFCDQFSIKLNSNIPGTDWLNHPADV